MDIDKVVSEVSFTMTRALREDVNHEAWHELVRLARLGAAVEAMPKGSLLNRGTGTHHMGDAWTFEDQWEHDYDGETPMEALSMKHKD